MFQEFKVKVETEISAQNIFYSFNLPLRKFTILLILIQNSNKK